MILPIAAWFHTGFMPHGHCFFWDPGILWTRVVSDAVIALAYFSIPAALLTMARRRPSMALRYLFALFSLFIVACGFSHVVSIVTVWWPVYAVESGVKAVTAVTSAGTAVALWAALPVFSSIPFPRELRAANQALEAEILERRAAEERARSLAEELEARVAARTAELAEMNQRLVASNRDLELFGFAASHDLRAPLRTTRSYAELLERRFADELGEDGATFVGFIVSESARMADLVDGLLVFSKSGVNSDDVSTVSMDQVVADVLGSLAADVVAVGARLEVEPLPPVLADPVLMGTLMQNLLSNALTYVGDETPVISVSGREVEGGRVSITVRDNGVGIAPEHHEEIFQVFKRLETSRSGAGIGLAICRRIVEAYGGDLRLQSVQGEGTSFTFELPGAIRPAASA